MTMENLSERQKLRILLSVAVASVEAFAQQPAQRFIVTQMFDPFTQGIGGWSGWRDKARRVLKTLDGFPTARPPAAPPEQPAAPAQGKDEHVCELANGTCIATDHPAAGPDLVGLLREARAALEFRLGGAHSCNDLLARIDAALHDLDEKAAAKP